MPTVLKSFFLLGALTALSTIPFSAADPPPPVQSLTLQQAVTLAIQNNLTQKLASAGTEQARGQALQAAAAILPHLTASMYQNRIFKENLAALGFPSDNTSFPQLLGPFNVFDARIQLVEKIFDLSAIWTAKAGRKQVDIARDEENLAKEQVASAAALAYLDALRSERAVADAQANADLAQNLFKLASDQHNAGLSTGVDVARSQTRAAQQNVRLIRAQVAANEAGLRLKRVIGLPLSTPLVLADPLRAVPLPTFTEDQALETARDHRFELAITQMQFESEHLALRAAKAGHLPTVTLNGDYGFSGNLPESTARTGSIGGRLDLPIFSGGSIHGEVQQAEGLERESQARYDDTRVQVEEDVRLSMQTLVAEDQEVKTADQAVALAERELKMARDRFSAGVGDNIQVLNAQTALADAQDDQIAALQLYVTTRINLAMALGEMQAFQF